MTLQAMLHLADAIQELHHICADAVYARAQRYHDTFTRGNKIVWAGNGGSATLCQHMAAEYVGRFRDSQRRPLPALALTADSATVTALANDFGYDRVFERQVQALLVPGDLLVVHSTSGESRNLWYAAHAAMERGAHVAALLGRDGGMLATRIPDSIIVPAHDTARIQELHLLVEHVICEFVDEWQRG